MTRSRSLELLGHLTAFASPGRRLGFAAYFPAIKYSGVLAALHEFESDELFPHEAQIGDASPKRTELPSTTTERS